VAFGRGEGAERLIAAVPRWLGRIAGLPTERAMWQGTSLALPAGWPARWSCVLSGRTLTAEDGVLSVADLFDVLPVALLLAEPDA
jgi:maltooligosyltrehalose synthase